MQSGISDWQLDYLHRLRHLIDTERERAARLWQRTRWLRLLTLPMGLAWVGLRLFINHSEEVWQAMWVVTTNPTQATARQRILAYWSMPRVRWMAYAQLHWMHRYLKDFVWLCVAGSLCF
ncbi:MAG: hypothetical protein RMJ83_09375, partial [Armatimonadota bacterium]|nr:hypothetical protein [Armatimonadota bacterium]